LDLKSIAIEGGDESGHPLCPGPNSSLYKRDELGRGYGLKQVKGTKTGGGATRPSLRCVPDWSREKTLQGGTEELGCETISDRCEEEDLSAKPGAWLWKRPAGLRRLSGKKEKRKTLRNL